MVPVLKADLKDLRLLHLRYQQHVVQGLEQKEFEEEIKREYVTESLISLDSQTAKTKN